MELWEAMERRHSVRAYEDRALEPEAKAELQSLIEQCNRESGLHMQLVLNEPEGFGGFMAHYGKFSGVQNYIALIGKKSPKLEETCGYYGEQLVLRAQQLGLNTCWVALTYSLPGPARREAVPGHRAGLWKDPGRAPQVKGPRGRDERGGGSP